MSELEALRRVEAAARRVCKDGECWTTWKELVDAVALLDAVRAVSAALPAAPAQTVTLAVWRKSTGSVMLDEPGSHDDAGYDGRWTRLGTVTLPLATEAGDGR